METSVTRRQLMQSLAAVLPPAALATKGRAITQSAVHSTPNAAL